MRYINLRYLLTYLPSDGDSDDTIKASNVLSAHLAVMDSFLRPSVTDVYCEDKKDGYRQRNVCQILQSA